MVDYEVHSLAELAELDPYRLEALRTRFRMTELSRRQHEAPDMRSSEQSDSESSRMPLDAVGETLSFAGALSDAPK
jgi:hypothetical protein